MPKEGENILKFKNHLKKCKAPFVIYADMECDLKPVQGCSNINKKSHTQTMNFHKPNTYSFYVVCKDKEIQKKFKPVFGECFSDDDQENLMKSFYEDLNKAQNKIGYLNQQYKDIKCMTDFDEDKHSQGKQCYICDKAFSDEELEKKKKK